MNRVFENHVVTMRESDNGMFSSLLNRMMLSKATKTAWKSAMHQESFDLTQEEKHFLMTSGLPLCNKTMFLRYKRLWAYAMEVADAKLQTLLQSLSRMEGWLGCTWYQHTTRFLSNPLNCLICLAIVKGEEIHMNEVQPCNRMVIAVAVSTMGVAALFGCGGGKSETAASVPSASTIAQAVAHNNSKLCVFKDDDEATKCQSGQISLFVPSSWGNEQLPVIVAAEYCDFNFPVVHTNGAVSCVFYKGRTVFQREASKAPLGPASASAGG